MAVSLRLMHFVGDILLLNLSIAWSILLFQSGNSVAMDAAHVYLIIFSNLTWLFLVMVSAPYQSIKGWTVAKIVKSQLAFMFIHLLVVACLVLIFKQHYSWLLLLGIYILFVPMFFLFRLLIYLVIKRLPGIKTRRNYAILGRTEKAAYVRKFYLLERSAGYRFAGYLDYEQGSQQWQEFCVQNDVREIFCCDGNIDTKDMQQLIRFGLDYLVKVKFVTETAPKSLQLEKFDQEPADLHAFAIDSAANQAIKRVFDVVGSSILLLLVMSWLIPLIGLIIKIDSRGPVFFLQLRNGEMNKPFHCFKFRTMVVNREADTKQATKGDPRITRVGSFLRKSSIDELPQLINVFLGEMSMIGPRPHPIKLNEAFAHQIENMMSRHYVKPGITGLAQCMGYRGETQDLADMENRVRLDRFYIENWSFWLDIKIIFLTVVSLIRGSDKAF